ncbi:MAG: methyltransferase domain-containing protein [Desulfobacterales bacterium]|nr:methyltransferase domain-containing protein [Desulfobacterales bacterium]
MFSLESFYKEYETDTRELKIRERNFNFLVPKSLDKFVDPDDVFHDFPLWSKIWEASMILADHLAGIAVAPEKHYLEIGSGLGLVGIVASSFGHQVTMTEYNADAINFARANAQLNLAPEDSNLNIMKVDWNRPQLDGLFDCIIGSEVIYNEKDYQSILKLFKTCLKPGGEIILVEGVRKTSMDFFKQMGRFFDIKAQKKVLRSSEKEKRVILAQMRFTAP